VGRIGRAPYTWGELGKSAPNAVALERKSGEIRGRGKYGEFTVPPNSINNLK